MKHTFLLAISCLLLAAASTKADISLLSVNELLADPNSGSGFNFDTDGDGTAETGDEFIELMNVSGSSLDISGWEIWVGSGGSLSERHEFAVGTTLGVGELITAVNSWDPGTPPAGFVQMDAGGGGIFGNGGDNFVLYDPTANEYCSYVYNGDPDLAGAGLPSGATLIGAVIDMGSDIDGQSIQAIPDGGTIYSIGAPSPGALNAVPEPSGALIVVLAGMGLLSRRRK